MEVFPWGVEVEAGFLDHLALEETASLVLLGLEGRHHTSPVSLVMRICASADKIADKNSFWSQNKTPEHKMQGNQCIKGTGL